MPVKIPVNSSNLVNVWLVKVGLKTSKPTLPFTNFSQFLSHVSVFSSAKSFITSFITERGKTDALRRNDFLSLCQGKLVAVVFTDSTYHNL